MQFGTYPLAHLGLRVGDLGRAKRFYIDTLGFGLLRESAEAVFMDAHGLLIALIGPAEQTDDADRFNPFRVGLDHLALGVADRGDLDGLQRRKAREVASKLEARRVPHRSLAGSRPSERPIADPDGRRDQES